MKIENTILPGVLLIHPQIHSDNRGYFYESFKSPEFEKLGLPAVFVQDNQALSEKGVIRGLHFQLNYPQGKLVRVSLGEVYDIALDIRPNSDHYGEWYGALLNDKNHLQMFIPPGFAHGYKVLSEQAVFQYKCTEIYHPEDEYGINCFDPEIAIKWPGSEEKISAKDEILPNLKDIPLEKLPKI